MLLGDFFLACKGFFLYHCIALKEAMVELVAQPVEQRPFKAKVVGSIPTWLTTKNPFKTGFLLPCFLKDMLFKIDPVTSTCFSFVQVLIRTVDQFFYCITVAREMRYAKRNRDITSDRDA